MIAAIYAHISTRRWFAIFLGGIWLAEWCWKPYREAQTFESDSRRELDRR